jgi:NDP-sugar pyrophosphorylase family protein
MLVVEQELRLERTPVLVLAGGLGTRLHPLTRSLPKVMVPVLGRPFLELVLEEMQRQGFADFVLSVGHLGDQVMAHFGDGSRFGYRASYVREPAPLGTGGAIRQALAQLERLSTFVVVNGDTLLEVDLIALLAHHRNEGQDLTLATTWVEDRERYGAVGVEQGRVVRFEEKRAGLGPGPIYGGVCAMNRRFIEDAQGAPEGLFSLERDLLPSRAGEIAVFETRGFFVDIGAPEVLDGLDQALRPFLASRSL